MCHESLRRIVFTVLGVALAGALAGAPAAGAEATGVELVDSCGIYVRIREGAGGSDPAELGALFERTKLCSDAMWTAAQDLVDQVSKTRRELRPRDLAPRSCELDPTPIDPKQSVRVGFKYLADHPERLHLPVPQLAREALETAFRCEPTAR